jgi:hypothetical protein
MFQVEINEKNQRGALAHSLERLVAKCFFCFIAVVHFFVSFYLTISQFYNILTLGMNQSLANKNVSIGGKIVITDWRQVKVMPPENLQEKIKANETAKKEILKQKEVVPSSNNTAIEVV